MADFFLLIGFAQKTLGKLTVLYAKLLMKDSRSEEPPQKWK